MSELTYTPVQEGQDGQTTGVAARRCADPAFVEGSSDRDGRASSTIAARRAGWLAAFTSDALDGARCHELRIVDENVTWRLVYRMDADAIVIAEVFKKKTQATLKTVIDACKRRLRAYDAVSDGKE